MIASSTARIFRIRVHSSDLYYGCLGGGKPVELTSGGPPFALAGNYAATTFSVDQRGQNVAEADVYNLKTRHEVRTLRLEEGATSTFNSLVLSRTGAVAVIWQTGGPDYQVIKVDSAGQTVLEAAPGIDPTSLALAGSRLYWTTDGQTRSTVLR